jgi:peroxiredoxin
MKAKHSGRDVAVVILWSLVAASGAHADRLDDVTKLETDYEKAEQDYFQAQQGKVTTDAENIRNYDAWPGWQFLPRFVAILEADPTDEAAYRACMWIFDRTGNVGNADEAIFEHEQNAWRIIAAHHAEGDKVPRLCLQAVKYPGPAQEEFLRGLLHKPNLSREHAGFATLALAEMLVRRLESIEALHGERPAAAGNEFANHMEQRRSPEWGKELTLANIDKFKAESSRLFRVVLDQYADVPCTISMPYFRDIAKLGDKAETSLHALERLSVGAEAPDIQGHDLSGNSLKLRDYRGRVVLLSFWFTGCAPCMAMIPKEKELIEKFKDQPFALLAVCADGNSEQGRKTAEEHGMNWPCWFDGEHGPIARDYNVLGWPTFYLIDKEGRIASKIHDREHMDIEIAKLLEGSQQ